MLNLAPSKPATAKERAYVFGDSEAVSIRRRVLEVELLVQLKPKRLPNLAVFRVEPIAHLSQLVRERLQARVVVRLDHEVVVLELVKVERLLHHFGVLGQRAVEFLNVSIIIVR